MKVPNTAEMAEIKGTKRKSPERKRVNQFTSCSTIESAGMTRTAMIILT
jgi:hypothetical protein